MAILLVTLLIATSWSNVNAQGKNLDDLIGEVFSKPETPATVVSPVTSLPPVTSAPPRGNPDETEDCVCVPYYLCNNGSINTNGESIIDIRINEGPCDTYIEVCCSKGNQVTEPITPAPVDTPTGCGNRHPEGVGFRITGDKENESQFGEFPWMVAILKEQSVDGNPVKLNVYQCGGSLIHPQVVLTAAHCVTSKQIYKVRAGEWDTQHTKELLPHQDRIVTDKVIHPQFYAGALYNDVALLFLESPVTLAENVDVVCLPPQGEVAQDGRCYATGWGKDTFGKKGKYQVILKKIDLPVVPNDSCQTSLRTTRLGRFFELHNSFICAGGETNKDTCKGDGGSPLVCPFGGKGYRYFQAGIVAWGIGCGENQVPGVYANVAMFRDWIDEQMKLRKLDISTYQF